MSEGYRTEHFTDFNLNAGKMKWLKRYHTNGGNECPINTVDDLESQIMWRMLILEHKVDL